VRSRQFWIEHHHRLREIVIFARDKARAKNQEGAIAATGSEFIFVPQACDYDARGTQPRRPLETRHFQFYARALQSLKKNKDRSGAV